jgi:hypothetical protein
MRISASRLVLAFTALLALVECLPQSPLRIGLVADAHAIVGAPATPLSYAGVARRTAYRTTVAATSAAAATTAAAQQSAAAAKAATPPPPPPAPPPPAAAPLPVGTVVTKLPTGCVSAPVSGIEYYLCGGNYYRAAFQGNNLVYVVQKP